MLWHKNQGAGGAVAGWDLSTASYDGVSFNVGSQDGGPSGVFFRSDGEKMYVPGRGNSSVFEYDLSTAWDISTTSYLQSFSVVAQESDPRGMFLKPDGTKMYVTGTSGDDVNEYDLSTAWDITSASYLQNFSVSSQETGPMGVFFKPDGTKMYVVGNVGRQVFEYDLSSAWDISTASYLQSFNPTLVGNENLMSVFFRPNGAKMYLCIYASSVPSGTAILEFNLSSAWDVSTATYVQRFSVFSQETQPEGVFFKTNGTKMYVIGNATNSVFSYSL